MAVKADWPDGGGWSPVGARSSTEVTGATAATPARKSSGAYEGRDLAGEQGGLPTLGEPEDGHRVGGRAPDQ